MSNEATSDSELDRTNKIGDSEQVDKYDDDLQTIERTLQQLHITQKYGDTSGQHSSGASVDSSGDHESSGSDGTYPHSSVRFSSKEPASRADDTASLDRNFIDLTVPALQSARMQNVPEDVPVFKSFVNVAEIQNAAKQGSSTAEKLLRAGAHFRNGLKLLAKEGPEDEILEEFALAFRLEDELLSFPGDFYHRLQKVIYPYIMADFEPSEVDKDAKVCYSYLCLDAGKCSLDFIEQYIKKYTKEMAFHIFYCKFCERLEEYCKGSMHAAKSSKEFPHSADLKWYVAHFCVKILERETGEKEATSRKQAINLFEACQRMAPQDHRFKAHALYGQAVQYHYLCSTSRKDTYNSSNLLDAYKKAKLAEKESLSCFKKATPSITYETILHLLRGKDLEGADLLLHFSNSNHRGTKDEN